MVTVPDGVLRRSILRKVSGSVKIPVQRAGYRNGYGVIISVLNSYPVHAPMPPMMIARSFVGRTKSSH